MDKPLGIPDQSGCYLFSNEDGQIIYVGKARVLSSRLSSYFAGSGLSPKTQALMSEARSVEWVVTPSEVDALILENELIKANQPRYNMRLKDDKSYPYLAIDKRSEWPGPYITRSSHFKGVKYFGPFSDVGALHSVVEELYGAFPVRSCTPHKFNYHQRLGRPCLMFDIGKCSGPCAGKVSHEEYDGLIGEWEDFFSGDVKRLRSRLEGLMSQAVEKQLYEVAATYRDALGALERASTRSVVVLDDHSNLDVVAVATATGRGVVVRLRVRHGRTIARNLAYVERPMDEGMGAILELAMVELYPSSEDVPAIVAVASSEMRSTSVVGYLESLRPGVEVVVPQRGGRRGLVELALGDAQAAMMRDSLRRTSDVTVRSQALGSLAKALGLPKVPWRIECFDMSHLQGTNYVGSMVVFEDGLPKKSEYRHFNVKTVAGNDDFASMEEVVGRRLGHWNDGAKSKFPRADLIIIDGGLGQLHAAEKAAKSQGLLGQVEFTALAKREELLYRPGSSEPIVLPRGSEELYLVQRLRDEAHRFAIGFHRTKRGRAMTKSVLDGIVGLGAARQARLVDEFGDLEAVRGASLEELGRVTWLPGVVAGRVYEHLHPDE
jgi:excinuclease ABC subunit C